METSINEFQNEPAQQKKKKGRTGLIVFLLLLLLAVIGGGAYYYTQRQEPQKAVDAYLKAIQQMDINTMENLLQSQDVSALDTVELRSDMYTEFFKSMNSQMTYEITKNAYHFQEGTAEVTAKIQYVDGTNIFMETISEFLRQLTFSAISGKDFSMKESEENFVSILTETAKTVEGKKIETTVTYSVVKTDSGWKIAALDAETVKFMASNYSGMENEINAFLEKQPSTLDSTVPESSGTTINMDNEKFSIRYTQHRVANDINGAPCLMLYYDYTNNSNTPSSAMVDVSIQAYQDGVRCDVAIPEIRDKAAEDHFTAEVQPGQTINVCQVFSLRSTEDVTLQATDAFNFDGDTTSQVLALQ